MFLNASNDRDNLFGLFFLSFGMPACMSVLTLELFLSISQVLKMKSGVTVNIDKDLNFIKVQGHWVKV